MLFIAVTNVKRGCTANLLIVQGLLRFLNYYLIIIDSHRTITSIAMIVNFKFELCKKKKFKKISDLT